MCAKRNSPIDQNNPTFGEAPFTWTRHTNEPSWIVGPWLGDYNSGACVTIMETQGIGDSEGRDCIHGAGVGEAVRNLSPIDAFVLIFKGTGTRFTKPLQDQLSFYEQLFGQDFWKRVIIEVSFWRHREQDKEDRLEDRGIDEGKFAHVLNYQLRRKFGLIREIPVVFIDPMYGIRRRREQPEELQPFKNETKKLWSFVTSNNPYKCEGHCNSPGFLEGKPTLMSESEIKGRIDDKVVLVFKIWFSGCEGERDRSYDIYKDGVKIWTVVDEQGEARTRNKPVDLIKNVNTPLNMMIYDRCSVSKGAQGQFCDNEKSSYKVVKVVFDKISEDAYGTYTVKNTLGGSEQVLIKKMVDGFYSEWSQWGKWDQVT